MDILLTVHSLTNQGWYVSGSWLKPSGLDSGGLIQVGPVTLIPHHLSVLPHPSTGHCFSYTTCASPLHSYLVAHPFL